mgnify:FL=1
MDLKILEINKENEYVLFRAEKDQNLWPYILFDATFDETGQSSNINRHSFIFPNLNVKRGDFIVLYTCKGKYETFLNKTGSRTHKLYWGFEGNIWNNGCDEALLVKVDDFKKMKV